ncbi:Nucleoside-diphosphate-sugar epimerase [Maribacter orientalis]|uniref:Nucleoside-diphosphate-sugar epimerase n=1 Tax=Maribacter orientalis TaxID=228957 RepID=A0A1H7RMB2_9FLAO|nr:NAD-dependent epimerase/dehydratase family protein [Maribacter orientalis]SEL61460.1 Nucleoside-diphosphate-sugar epimerase [Maribacter orientalis]
MTKNIGIIGCGWLGLPLAEELHKVGYRISGTTTSEEKIALLKSKGIQPFKISISEDGINGAILEFLSTLSILIINIPPGLRGKGPKESYIEKIKLLYSAIKKTEIKQVIFASSTAVYGEAEGIVTEKTKPAPNTASGVQLLACENLFLNDEKLHTTIIRFGGLIGPERHPITMLSGRENLKGGNAPINLIHLDDCIGIIKSIIHHNHWNAILNAVYPKHPTKEEYYTKEALKKGITPPHYESENNKTYKLITTCSLFLINEYDFLTSIN